MVDDDVISLGVFLVCARVKEVNIINFLRDLVRLCNFIVYERLEIVA